MNRSSVTYEPEEGDMKFSEHDRKIIGSKVAKARLCCIIPNKMSSVMLKV